MNLWNKRNEDRPKAGPYPRDAFKTAITKAISEAEGDGLLAVEIYRYLDNHRAGTNTKRHCAICRWGAGDG
jgi:hypothetical protein